jgi:transcriptional regulator of acetoin/glycerol metabolism
MPQPGAYSFRRKWEDENEETAVMPLQADWNATPQCFSSIRRSWERCRELGLFRAHPARLELLEQEELERRKDQHIFFVHLAANELNILRRAIAGTAGMVLLADPQGTILDGRGDSGFVGKAKRIALRPGATWSELLEGTNAIGTALVEQQLVRIAGNQHFLEENRFLVCTAIPVMSPTGEIAGILDISGDVRNPPTHASMLLQLATARIEHSWVSLHSSHDLLAAFHPHPNWLGTPHEGLLAFRDELLVAANPAALRLLRMIPKDINRVRWGEIFRNRSFYGKGEIYPRSHPGVFYGSVQKTLTSVAMPAAPSPAGKVESRSTEILIRDEAIWDTESIQMLTRAKRAFEAGIPILLQGETGTGKEVFVRALQRLSSRASEPLVPVNCAAIPEGLQEAEIFGYEEGAFTGARRKGSPGYIRRAEGGVLFLDEIGDMPLALQAQLLRVLQDGEVTPLGARRSVRVDFRLVAATHHDLQAAVAEGSFRADLYYRLRHMVFYLPPLRKRPNLGGILDAMLASLGGEARGVRLTTAARQKLLEHGWPGNLRELSNLLSALLAFAEDGSWIDADSLPQDIMESREAEPEPEPEPPQKLSDITDDLLRQAIREHGGNMSAAARQLGLHRSTLYRRLAGAQLQPL